MDVTVVSYNMSVFSAMGYFGTTRKLSFSKGGPVANSNESKGIFPSEARFLASATKSKEYFQNAIDHLVNTVRTKKASVIGIQEFHPPTLDEIMEPLRRINPNYQACPFGKKIKNDACVLTIWDSKLLGEKATEYHEDIGATKTETGEDLFPGGGAGADGGRPISIIITEKGFILMNFHGINRPRLVPSPLVPVDVGPFLQRAIEIHAQKSGILDMDLQKLIITCDSNDRGHLLSRDGGLKLQGLTFHDGHPKEGGAKSCCYNYDSCNLEFPSKNVEGDIPKTMGKSGAEANYSYTGDYVLGANVKQAVEVVPSPKNPETGESIASDHALVFGIVTIPSSGGKSRRNRNRKMNKRKETRKRR
jgi:hypothetical protein